MNRLRYDEAVWRAAVVAVLGLACACASAPPRCAIYEAPARRQPFMWKVSGSQGSLVLYATLQAAAAYHAAPAALEELDQADVFVTEADEFPAAADLDDREELARMFYLPQATTLRKLLGETDYRQLERHVDRPVLHLKPWAAMMLLAREAYAFPTPSLSIGLIRRARERRIPIEFLERWDEQAQFFDEAVTPAKLGVMIREYSTFGCQTKTRLEAFRAGDDAVFANKIATATEPAVRRVERWTTRLEPYLTSGRRAFVAIGISQILGPHGLLARLTARGYTVQRMW